VDFSLLLCNTHAGDFICAEIAQIGRLDRMDLLRALRTFTRIAETGSFSAVARELHESHSAVTRLIGQLEAHFGVRLFHRTTRKLSLTEDGRDLLGHAQQMLELAETMEEGLRQHRSSPHGHVRLGSPVAFGLFLTPRVPALLARHPGLSLELVMSDHLGDLIEDRLDLTVRVGPIADASLVARVVGTFRRLAVASPAYLDRRGAPRTPAELTQHECILHHNAWRDAETWSFKGPDGLVQVQVSGRFGADNSEAIQDAALGGHGIALLWETRVLDDIRAGRLQRILPDYSSTESQALIVYPSRRHLPPRTRVVIDFVVELLQELEQQRNAAKRAAPVEEAWLV
jgi:DNA-binding transcriptional LysR family regulator